MSATIGIRPYWKLVLVAVVAVVVALPCADAKAAPLYEVKKLTASDAQAGDLFGSSVAISGDTAIAGASWEDAGGVRAGAAYIFERDQGGPGNWGEVKKFTASDIEAHDRFGSDVALHGDNAIVGAAFENVQGAAYVFERDHGGPGNWGEVEKLIASDAEEADRFGLSVAINGDFAIVGADQEDAGGTEAGAAYVFARDQGGPGNWGEVKKLTASDAQAGDMFGKSVGLSGDTAIVGAFWEDAGGFRAGAAYVFQRDQGGAGNWGEVKKLTASDAQADDWFGTAVAMSGDTAVVGANREDAGSAEAGAAYVFERDRGGPGNWGEEKKLMASDAQDVDYFGWSVAVNGDTAVVGAALEDAGGLSAGAAYVFTRNYGGPGNWGEVKKLTASDAEPQDQFGQSLALTGNTAIVGSRSEGAAGVEAGAAYVFEGPVQIEIKPGRDLSSINARSRGVVPVAILSSANFDAPSELDKVSATFGRTGDEDSLAFCTGSTEDVNDDGLADLVCHFRTQDTAFQVGDTEGILRGQTMGGMPIEARGAVRIVR